MATFITSSRLLQLAILLFSINGILILAKGTYPHQFFPIGPIEYRHMENSSINRRELAPFQLCLNCSCCAADDPSNCSGMPCCFGINCDLPDKPYGVCAFVPKTCNCTGCS